MSHVFISYVRKNIRRVDRLRQALEVHGIEVWMDKSRLPIGGQWKTTIRTAIKRAEYFLACFSKEYEDRKMSYMNEELLIGIEQLRQRPPSSNWFMPVLLSKSNLPEIEIAPGRSLSDLNWVELYKDWDVGIASIVKAIDPRRANITDLLKQFHDSDLATPLRLIAVTKLIDENLTDDIAIKGIVNCLNGVSPRFINYPEMLREAIAIQLPRLGSKCIPSLKRLLNDKCWWWNLRESTIWHIIDSVVKIGTACDQGRPLLRKLMSIEDPRLWLKAAIILAESGKNAQLVISMIGRGMDKTLPGKHPPYFVDRTRLKYQLFEALAGYGELAIPTLERLYVGDPFGAVRGLEKIASKKSRTTLAALSQKPSSKKHGTHLRSQ
jgi:hypothetical protein